MDLRKILASSIRQKILIVLAANKEMRIMQLVGKVGSTYNEVNRNLKLLKAENLIIDSCSKQVKHGKVRVIKLNYDNPNIIKLLQALKGLES